MVVVGFIVIDNPDAIILFPHEPSYQYQFAPVPRLPPDIPIVADEPSHIVSLVMVRETGTIEIESTVIETETQVVVLQIPSALTQ